MEDIAVDTNESARAWMRAVVLSDAHDDPRRRARGPEGSRETCRWVTQFLVELGEAANGVPDESVTRALRYVFDGNQTNYGARCVAPSNPIDERVAYIRATEHLFRDVFEPRLRTWRSDARPSDRGGLLGLALRWWEETPLLSHPDAESMAIDPRTWSALWETLVHVLDRPSHVCAWSAVLGADGLSFVPLISESLTRLPGMLSDGLRDEWPEDVKAWFRGAARK